MTLLGGRVFKSIVGIEYEDEGLNKSWNRNQALYLFINVSANDSQSTELMSGVFEGNLKISYMDHSSGKNKAVFVPINLLLQAKQ